MDLIKVSERTSENTLDAVRDGHNICRATLEHRHIWRNELVSRAYK